jgi:hypothetical protein
MKEQIGVTLKNTDIKIRARKTVETITAKLDHSLIKIQFDESIDEAARQFTHKAGCPISHKEFHKIITDFVMHIYDKGLNANWKLSAEPLGQVIELLEKHYSSTYGTGYTAAVLDAAETQEGGIDAVLNQLAQIIKDTERSKHINAVFTVNIDPADWHLKCEIVNVILDDYRQFLPQHLLKCKPWELANEIPAIIYRYICSESALQELLCNQQISWKR